MSKKSSVFTLVQSWESMIGPLFAGGLIVAALISRSLWLSALVLLLIPISSLSISEWSLIRVRITPDRKLRWLIMGTGFPGFRIGSEMNVIAVSLGGYLLKCGNLTLEVTRRSRQSDELLDKLTLMGRYKPFLEQFDPAFITELGDALSNKGLIGAGLLMKSHGSMSKDQRQTIMKCIVLERSLNWSNISWAGVRQIHELRRNHTTHQIPNDKKAEDDHDSGKEKDKLP